MVFVGLCVLGIVPRATAEWANQDITLTPGWNAIFLEVQPEDSSCETIFAGLPVKSVWAWNEQFTSVQYVRDPSEILPEEPEWLTYFPGDSPNAFLTNLRALVGGRPYLVELDGSAPVTLELRGTVRVESRTWLSNSYNLAGFHIDPATPPTFASYFSPSGSHTGQPMYKLDAAGHWVRIENPGTERVERGRAYWIYCSGQSTYSGPLGVEIDRDRRLNFGQFVTEKTLVLRNETEAAKSVTLTVGPSLRPTRRARGEESGAPLPRLAGDVALSYRTMLAWEAFREPLTVTVEAESELAVPLAVLRQDMPDAEGTDDRFESIIEIRDGEGGRFTVPVLAQKMLTKSGLWVGTVTLDHVSEPANGEDPDTPRKTGSEFTFRVIIHVDDQQQARLLQQVVLLQVQPEEDTTILDVSEGYVLVTDDALIPQFAGVSLRDGELVGRRISSPAFAHTQGTEGVSDPSFASSVWPIELTGTPTTNLNGVIRMHYDDPLNPFVHRFHPDHNNLNERFQEENKLPEGSESFTILREVNFEFFSTSPLGSSVPNWGYDIVGGVYTETLTGVHKSRINVKGTFQLNHVIDVAVLNDGL
jgi:hypothetical protein